MAPMSPSSSVELSTGSTLLLPRHLSKENMLHPAPVTSMNQVCLVVQCLCLCVHHAACSHCREGLTWGRGMAA